MNLMMLLLASLVLLCLMPDIIDQHDDHCFIIGGDFNVDFNMHKLHPRLLRDVCNVNNLRLATLHET